MIATTTNTVVGVFTSADQAEKAVRELRSAGYSEDHIGVISRNDDTTAAQNEGSPNPAAPRADTGHNAASDAGVGAAVGGLGGLLVGFAALAIPGVGPVIAAGPLLAAIGGIGVGAIAGGLIGAMTNVGVPEEEAHYYAEGVRRGDTVVTVQTDDSGGERAREILDRNGAVDIEGRVSSWRQRGWVGHNPGAEPLSADELRREREYYGASESQAYEWQNMSDKERAHAGCGPETDWPHREAYDIGRPLVETEAGQQSATSGTMGTTASPGGTTGSTASSGTANRSAQNRERSADTEDPGHYDNAGADLAGLDRDLMNSNREFGASIENNVRNVDPITKKIEGGFKDAMESAVRSARRARIYGRKSQ